MTGKMLVGWISGTLTMTLLLLLFTGDPIDTVIRMPATERNITISGEWGVVTIVGDDAEKFLDAVLPHKKGQFEDTTGGENTSK